MRPNKIKRQGRRRPHHFRFRPKGFSDPLNGPIFRKLFDLLGVPREQRRQTYNHLALAMVVLFTFGFGVSSLISGGIGAGIGGLVGGLAIGWVVITVFRFFR